MWTSTIGHDQLAASVIAVPPLGRTRDYEIDIEQNRRLLSHLERGGITSILYGGNANIYNISLRDYEILFGSLPSWADDDTWVIPSIGPAYGTMIDHVDVLRQLDYPTAMALPLDFPSTPEGVATGIRRVAERYGRKIVVYIKSERYLTPTLVGELYEDGVVAFVKYAVDLPLTARDTYLEDLLERVDRRFVVSGIGERPAIGHLTDYGLQGFTSGAACVAPRHSMAMLHALKAGRVDDARAFQANVLPLEDLRDEISPIRVLHDAVTGAGIADMGPMLPMLANVCEFDRSRVAEVAQTLARKDAALS